MVMKKNKEETQLILKHWQNAVPDDRLAHLVRDSGRAYSRALQVRLGQHDVPFGHWTFLRILWESDGLTQSELSVQAGVMEPTTFSAMKKMESLGYITRRHSAENKKNLYVYLTPKGRKLKQILVPLAEQVNQVSVKGISSQEVATTRRVLLAILNNLAKDDAS
jgi:DNA-binding MarR family transcriptional regulator